ncbi:hypothetical protein [Pseudorhodobacter sp.]|uniref:hypothetical protein n=1 Tax=Pseudorhodobacter sp. TaxID=1934400 RepID=UPI002647D5B3|nr:hypothetical protein [Pseudorhodobacter sp.]MDN5786557.1 hypothetical protein [Pseudorhodobacter sp.]
MLMDMIATIAAGAACASVVIVLRHLTRGRFPKWALPASIGLGMLLFSIWNEYTWYARTTAALPAQVVILSAPTDKVLYRPWSYLFPVATRFAAFDRPGMKISEANPAIRRGDVLLVQRWVPTRRVSLAFDCAGNRRADLVEGAEVAPDGTLTGGQWTDVGADDELQRAACQEG